MERTDHSSRIQLFVSYSYFCIHGIMLIYLIIISLKSVGHQVKIKLIKVMIMGQLLPQDTLRR